MRCEATYCGWLQLEKYSSDLEGIVAERTAELQAEKNKTEELICRTCVVGADAWRLSHPP